MTGAGGGGSGQGEALRLGREAVSVVVNEINEARGRETVRLKQANGGRAAFFLADVGDEQAVRALIQFAETTYGGLDILINNASAPYGPPCPIFFHAQCVGVSAGAPTRSSERRAHQYPLGAGITGPAGL